jgi:hypothetical protein
MTSALIKVRLQHVSRLLIANAQVRGHALEMEFKINYSFQWSLRIRNPYHFVQLGANY